MFSLYIAYQVHDKIFPGRYSYYQTRITTAVDVKSTDMYRLKTSICHNSRGGARVTSDIRNTEAAIDHETYVWYKLPGIKLTYSVLILVHGLRCTKYFTGSCGLRRNINVEIMLLLLCMYCSHIGGGRGEANKRRIHVCLVPAGTWYLVYLKRQLGAVFIEATFVTLLQAAKWWATYYTCVRKQYFQQSNEQGRGARRSKGDPRRKSQVISQRYRQRGANFKLFHDLKARTLHALFALLLLHFGHRGVMILPGTVHHTRYEEMLVSAFWGRGGNPEYHSRRRKGQI